MCLTNHVFRLSKGAFDRDETSNLAETAFKLCDVEEPVGLTWTEVEDCEVKFHNNLHSFITSFKKILILQETFCAVLSFQCPTHSDFQGFDQNQDGVLTWQEYQEVYDSLGN